MLAHRHLEATSPVKTEGQLAAQPSCQPGGAGTTPCSMKAHIESLYKRYVASPKSQELILRLTILALVYLWAFSIRLVSTAHWRGTAWQPGPAGQPCKQPP